MLLSSTAERDAPNVAGEGGRGGEGCYYSGRAVHAVYVMVAGVGGLSANKFC
jgi:hypothetical protein